MQIDGPPADFVSAVRPARAVALLMTLVVGLAFLALSMSGLGLLWKVIALLAALVHVALSVRRLLQPPIVRIGLEEGRLLTWDQAGASRRYGVRGRPFLSPVYLGLPLVDDDGHRSRLGLFRGQVDSQLWRQALIRFRGRLTD